jgi:hypothetical protein
MQFVWLNKQGVASDQGFVLQRVDRYAYEYREAKRTMRLEGESIVAGLGDSSFGFGFYSHWRDASWQPLFHDIQVSEDDRMRIVRNIKEAMAFKGGMVEFD